MDGARFRRAPSAFAVFVGMNERPDSVLVVSGEHCLRLAASDSLNVSADAVDDAVGDVHVDTESAGNADTVGAGGAASGVGDYTRIP